MSDLIDNLDDNLDDDLDDDLDELDDEWLEKLEEDEEEYDIFYKEMIDIIQVNYIYIDKIIFFKYFCFILYFRGPNLSTFSIKTYIDFTIFSNIANNLG